MGLNKYSEKELYEEYQSCFYSLMRFECEKGIDPMYDLSEEKCRELLLHSWFTCGLNKKLSDILTLQGKNKDYEKAGKELFDYLYDIADEVCEKFFLKEKTIESNNNKSKAKRPKYSK